MAVDDQVPSPAASQITQIRPTTASASAPKIGRLAFLRPARQRWRSRVGNEVMN